MSLSFKVYSSAEFREEMAGMSDDELEQLARTNVSLASEEIQRRNCPEPRLPRRRKPSKMDS